MVFFIPAWYSNNDWKETEQFWYRPRMQTEVDDTVKQIQLFQRNDIAAYCIVLLSYTPNLRHFLHRQSVFRAPYWSVFDAIQCVERKKPAVLSFHNLKWPSGVEFVYSSFAVIAMLNREKYAQIEFGDDGNPIQVDLFREEKLRRRNIYDDRGFLSSTAVFEDGKQMYEQYLDEKGVWKLTRYADGRVVVNPNSAWFRLEFNYKERRVMFRKKSYTNLEEIIEEVFGEWLKFARRRDVFCVAAHDRHTEILLRKLNGFRTLYSVFGDRVNLEDEAVISSLCSSSIIVCDTDQSAKKVSGRSPSNTTPVISITPYDTRAEKGISLQLQVQNILLPIDRLSEAQFAHVICILAEYLAENGNARVQLFTREAMWNREQLVLDQVSEILRRIGYPPQWARKESGNQAEFSLEEEDQIPILFTVRQCVDELAVSQCVREQRLLVELSPKPDLFLQIACVSMGVPQILREENDYMADGKNGRINRTISELPKDISWYLNSLTNWNEAMVCSYELGKKNTSQKLAEKWRKVISYIEFSDSASTGSERSQN